MFPEGLFGLRPFLLILPFALVAANVFMLRQARREGVAALRVIALQIGVGVFALSGAKLFALAEGGWNLTRPLADLLNYGWRYPGALMGILVGLLVVRPLAVPGLPLARYADWNAFAIAIGHLVLRWSCFLAGCCTGNICHGPLCLRFPPQSEVWYHHEASSLLATPTSWSEPVFPLHFALMAAAFAVLLVLLWLDPRRRFNGQTFLVFLVLHDGAKFALEFFRAPEVPELRLAAALSVTTGLVGLLVLGLRERRGRLARLSTAAPEARAGLD